MITPEVIAEQIMGYAVWATELIPTLTPPSKPHTVAILPQGPHFYTWLLQAAGYLLLDGKKKKMLVISEQYDEPKDIFVDGNAYGPVFGQSRKHSLTTIAVLAHQIGAKIARPEQVSIAEQISFQLPFLKVITDTQELLHISIGKELSQIPKKKLINRIKNHIHDYNIVLLTNIELAPSSITKKIDEQKQLSALIQKKTDNRIVEIFQEILKSQKKKPEIVAYVNPGDLGAKSSLRTRYVCAVG